MPNKQFLKDIRAHSYATWQIQPPGTLTSEYISQEQGSLAKAFSIMNWNNDEEAFALMWYDRNNVVTNW